MGCCNTSCRCAACPICGGGWCGAWGRGAFCTTECERATLVAHPCSPAVCHLHCHHHHHHHHQSGLTLLWVLLKKHTCTPWLFSQSIRAHYVIFCQKVLQCLSPLLQGPLCELLQFLPRKVLNESQFKLISLNAYFTLHHTSLPFFFFFFLWLWFFLSFCKFQVKLKLKMDFICAILYCSGNVLSAVQELPRTLCEHD